MARPRTLSMKLSAVLRVEAGESGRTVGADLGVGYGQVHRWCRAYRAWGEAGLLRGKLKAAAGACSAEFAAAEAETFLAAQARTVSLGAQTDAQRIAALERKVAQQALELDFFRTALQHVEELRQAKSMPGAMVSTPPSGRGRRSKATARMNDPAD